MKSKITTTINIFIIIIFLFIAVSALFVLDIPKASAQTIIRDSSPSQNKYLHIPWCDYPYRCPVEGNNEPWVIDGKIAGLNNYTGTYFYECGSDLHLGHCTRGYGGRESEGKGRAHGSWIGGDGYGGWTSPGNFWWWSSNPPTSTANKVEGIVGSNNKDKIIWGRNPPDLGCDGSAVKYHTAGGVTYAGVAADTTLFRNEFYISDASRIDSVHFFGVADDWLKVWINGKSIGETFDQTYNSQTKSFELRVINTSISPNIFQTGDNVIAIQASNKGYWYPVHRLDKLRDFNQAGLYYKLTINMKPPPPTCSISANPTKILSGQSSTLSWSSTNATSCSVSPGGFTGTSGSRTVFPTSTTTYTLSCSGQGGNCSASVTVYHGPSATNLTVTHDDYCCATSPPIRLSWKFSDPDPGDYQTAYQVQIDRDSNFALPIDIDSGKVTGEAGKSNEYAPRGLSFNTQYYWQVKVWDKDDVESFWVSSSFTTKPKHPSTNFEWQPSSPSVGEIVDFTDKTTVDKTATIKSWQWNIPDANYLGGTNSQSQHPIVKFISSGEKKVELEVTDSNNNRCKKSKLIKVQLPLPGWKEVAPF